MSSILSLVLVKNNGIHTDNEVVNLAVYSDESKCSEVIELLRNKSLEEVKEFFKSKDDLAYNKINSSIINGRFPVSRFYFKSCKVNQH